ncbi:MAG: hypothetical protein EOP20_01010 [Hyphomicrobiales bacterium]|nr:MAG: hypothetical protein EOP20_01010 [Hyphomicrobiales bacterium]
MRPAPAAKPLLFSYDGWLGGGMLFVVRATGKAVRRGYEFSETVAWIDLTAGDRATSLPGRL